MCSIANILFIMQNVSCILITACHKSIMNNNKSCDFSTRLYSLLPFDDKFQCIFPSETVSSNVVKNIVAGEEGILYNNNTKG